MIVYLREQGIRTTLNKTQAHSTSRAVESRGNHIADFLANLAITGRWAPSIARSHLPAIDDDDPDDLCDPCKEDWAAKSKKPRIETRAKAQS